MNRICLLLLLLAPAYVAAEDKPLWTWHEPATELYSPSFSKNGEELTLVRKRHIPDGHEAEEHPQAELKKGFEGIDKNERYADPEVVIVKVGTKVASRVDWGWAPAFSPDGQQVVYAYQKKPISGFRVLAETLAGNDIRIFRRDGKGITTLATPASGYLSDPIFAPDGMHVVYSLGDATNGAWGGNVGIGRVSIDGKNNEILYPALKEFGLFHLIGPKQYVGTRLVALRSKPTSAGTYIANSYSYELLDLGPPTKVVYAWTDHESNERPQGFGASADGTLLVYDHGWRQVGTKMKRARNPSTDDDPGILSPDGRTIAVVESSDLNLRDRETQKPLKAIKVKGEIRAVAWSHDSHRVAVVSTRYKDAGQEIFDHDEIAIFGL